jgi:ABC-type phosphate transport system permease subunit
MQLAKINEQLAIKNHRFKSILKIIACIILLIFILVMICLLLYSNIHAQSYN